MAINHVNVLLQDGRNNDRPNQAGQWLSLPLHYIIICTRYLVCAMTMHPLELIGLLMPGKRTWNVLSLEQRSWGRGEGGSHFCLYRALTIVGLY